MQFTTFNTLNQSTIFSKLLSFNKRVYDSRRILVLTSRDYKSLDHYNLLSDRIVFINPNNYAYSRGKFNIKLLLQVLEEYKKSIVIIDNMTEILQFHDKGNNRLSNLLFEMFKLPNEYYVFYDARRFRTEFKIGRYRFYGSSYSGSLAFMKSFMRVTVFEQVFEDFKSKLKIVSFNTHKVNGKFIPKDLINYFEKMKLSKKLTLSEFIDSYKDNHLIWDQLHDFKSFENSYYSYYISYVRYSDNNPCNLLRNSWDDPNSQYSPENLRIRGFYILDTTITLLPLLTKQFKNNINNITSNLCKTILQKRSNMMNLFELPCSALLKTCETECQILT